MFAEFNIDLVEGRAKPFGRDVVSEISFMKHRLQCVGGLECADAVMEDHKAQSNVAENVHSILKHNPGQIRVLLEHDRGNIVPGGARAQSLGYHSRGEFLKKASFKGYSVELCYPLVVRQRQHTGIVATLSFLVSAAVCLCKHHEFALLSSGKGGEVSSIFHGRLIFGANVIGSNGKMPLKTGG